MAEEKVQDVAEAQYQLGLAYLYGTGVAKDYAKAAECFADSCRRGYMPARRELGIMYASGQGVEPDMEKAVLLLGQAADSLDPSALYHLGLMYEVGTGVPKDLQKAVRMLAYAAEMGFPGADVDAERIDAVLTEQRNRNLRARPLLRLQISDVDVEAACCKPMLDALLAQDIVFIDSFKGPALLGEDADGMDAVLDRCPYCGARVQIVPRDKKYRSQLATYYSVAGRFMTMDQEEKWIEEAAGVMQAAVDRKRAELEDLEKRKKRYRSKERIAETDEVMDYLRAEIPSYLIILSDIKDDISYLEGVDTDEIVDIDRPKAYDDYLKSKGEDVVEEDRKAVDVRDECMDRVTCEMHAEIGRRALESKKMIRVLLENEEALCWLGEAIFEDDDLFDRICEILEDESGKKPKKSKKKGKGSKKSKKKGKSD